MKKQRNYHIGGEQMPLIVPESDWVRPAELPDLPAMGVRLVAEDLETKDEGLARGRGPGWATRAGHICGIAMAWDGGSLYVPLAHPDTDCFDRDAVTRWLAHVHAKCEMVYQNGGYDLGWQLAELGLPAPAVVHDAIAAAVMIDENRLSYKLDDLCRWQGLPGKDERVLEEYFLRRIQIIREIEDSLAVQVERPVL